MIGMLHRMQSFGHSHNIADGDHRVQGVNAMRVPLHSGLQAGDACACACAVTVQQPMPWGWVSLRGMCGAYCAVQRGQTGWPGGSMQPTQRNMSCACRAAAVPGMAHRHEQAVCWANLLACATQHGASCGVQLGGRSGELGRRGAGREGTGRAVDAVCAAVHHWWPVRGGVGLASGGSAPESDGWREQER